MVPLPVDGTLTTRAFHGDYELTITMPDGKTITAQVTIPEQPTANIRVVPLSPRAYRQVGLVRLRGKRGTDGVRLVAAALSALRRPASRKKPTSGTE